MKERLHKFMATSGIASRRKCEEIIFEGRVKVNGIKVNNIVMVDQDDYIEVDGKPIKKVMQMVYILLNKPTDIITSSKDQFGRKTVLDIVKIDERIFPVGRLDYDTSGALLLTNDGELANQMMHPSHCINKVYVAEVLGHVSDDEITRFEEGLEIEEYRTSPSRLIVLSESKDTSEIEITIHEGKNRQVRKMCEKIGHPVIKLMRISIDNIHIGELKSGEWRYLNEEEIRILKSTAISRINI